MSSILEQLNGLTLPEDPPNESASASSSAPPSQLPPIQSNARRQRKKRRKNPAAPAQHDTASDTIQLVQESPRSNDTLSPRPIDPQNELHPTEQVNDAFQIAEDVMAPQQLKQSSKSVRFDETLDRTEYLSEQNYPETENTAQDQALQELNMASLDGLDRGVPIPAGGPSRGGNLNEAEYQAEDIPVDIRYQTLLAKHAAVETNKVHKPHR